MKDGDKLSYQQSRQPIEPLEGLSKKFTRIISQFNRIAVFPELALILSLLAFVPNTLFFILGLLGIDRYFPGYTSELMTSNAIGRYLYTLSSWTYAHAFTYSSITFSIISLSLVIMCSKNKDINKVLFKIIATCLSVFSIIASLLLLLLLEISMGV